MRKRLVLLSFLFSALFVHSFLHAEDYKTHLKKGKDALTVCRHKEKDALSSTKKAYDLAPGEYDTAFWYGRALYENRIYDDAASKFEQAVKLKPKDVEANAHLAYTYGRIGENIIKRGIYMIKSATQMKKVLDMNPNYADAYFSLAIACTYMGWFEKPTGIFRKVAGIILKSEKDVDNFTAEGLFKKTISLDPKKPWYYGQYGWYFLKRGKPADAKKQFDKAMALAQKDVKCGMKEDALPRAIAIYYEEAKMWDEALKHANIALQWNPKDLCLNEKFSIKRLLNRLKQEKASNKPLLDNVADEL